MLLPGGKRWGVEWWGEAGRGCRCYFGVVTIRDQDYGQRSREVIAFRLQGFVCDL